MWPHRLSGRRCPPPRWWSERSNGVSAGKTSHRFLRGRDLWTSLALVAARVDRLVLGPDEIRKDSDCSKADFRRDTDTCARGERSASPLSLGCFAEHALRARRSTDARRGALASPCDDVLLSPGPARWPCRSASTPARALRASASRLAQRQTGMLPSALGASGAHLGSRDRGRARVQPPRSSVAQAPRARQLAVPAWHRAAGSTPAARSIVAPRRAQPGRRQQALRARRSARDRDTTQLGGLSARPELGIARRAAREVS